THRELQYLFDRCFVQPWHRQQVRRFANGGTATGGRRFWFVWYCSLPCKLTHAPHCFHLEARCQGRSVLRPIGFEKFRTFDLVNFWHRHLEHQYWSTWV